ncbi:M23 family metallopeptidase [Fundidesulfovibrio terrae]|uniref:M23 family metallopeptidase n=1 Tax=Fundidesulfovibrio terrae TaxID=2922866 RepID=UPI001FAFA6D1|nr:M23 family metallopeptidase [Fundidesulfovibrio terrae]
MIIRALVALLFLAFAAVSQAATLVEGPLSVTVPEAVGEGAPFLVEVRLQNQVEKVTVEWLGKTVDVTMNRREGAFRGEVLLGAGLGCPHGEQTLVVEALRPNRREMVLGKITVNAVDFPEQRLKLPPKMVTPSKDDLARIKREQELITKALAGITPRRFWSFPFLRPVPGEVTSAFGLRRILNGQPRSPHSGLDLDGKTGDPVAAANQGKVVLVGDFYFNGKSVFIDHGQGVISMYFHLSRVDVVLGQYVERGHQVGQVGASGRATGPHLHFGMKILGQAVDPTPLFTAESAEGLGGKGGS